MNLFKKMSAGVAGVAVAAALGASANAALLDLTESANVASLHGVNSSTISFNGRNITFTSFINGVAGGLLNTNDTVSNTSDSFCVAGGGDFACQRDGIGIRDDEIGGREMLKVDFGGKVHVTGLSFLDLFCDDAGCDVDVEAVKVEYDNGGGLTSQTFLGTELFVNGGNGFFDTGLIDLGFVTSMSFMFDAGNDEQGVGDVALAGLDFEPVPVPAAGLLFGTALVGAAAARRRRRA